MRFHDEALPIQANTANVRDVGGLLMIHRAAQNKEDVAANAERLPLIQVKRA
jgi:hypothetical protein